MQPILRTFEVDNDSINRQVLAWRSYIDEDRNPQTDVVGAAGIDQDQDLIGIGTPPPAYAEVSNGKKWKAFCCSVPCRSFVFGPFMYVLN